MHEVLRFMGSTYVTDSDLKEVRGRYLRYEVGNASGTIAGYRRGEEVSGGSRFVEGRDVRFRDAMKLLERPLGMLCTPGPWSATFGGYEAC